MMNKDKIQLNDQQRIVYNFIRGNVPGLLRSY